MTLRAIVLGLCAVMLLCGLTYFNDQVLLQTMLIGNHLPIFIYGSLIVFLLFINPLLLRIGRKVALSGQELTVILVMVLASAMIPGSGLMRVFTNFLMLPHHFNRVDASWSKEQALQMLPKQMLADPANNEDIALNGFTQGLAIGNKSPSLSEIPWNAWTHTLMFWAPFLIALWVALLGLALVIHRQWSDHEQLPYPLATFANNLLPQGGQARSDIFQNSLFWVPAILIMALHLNNYIFTWFPNWVRIPMGWNFQPVLAVVPELRAEDAMGLFNFRLFFSVIAIAYFVSAEVSLALGIGPFIYLFVLAFFAGHGVALRAGGQLSIDRFFAAGTYLGVLVSILYTGRYFYWHAAQRALGFRSKEEIPVEVVWGMRVFLVASTIVVALLTSLGVDWQLALLFAFLVFTTHVVMGRVLAETGMFFISPYWIPSGIILGLFGAKALGPEVVAVLGLVALVVLVDPREALMPFLVNNLKLMDLRKLNPGKLQLLCGCGLVLGLAVAVPTTLYWQYNKGARMSDAWMTASSRDPLAQAVATKQRLSVQGALEESRSLKGFARFSHITFDKGRVIALTAGFILVLAFSFARLRFTKWPIHPFIFLFLIPWTATQLAFSFMLGWLIKSSVTKFGGEQTYQKYKPLMVGVIAGDMIGGLIPIFCGWIYYLLNGGNLLPKAFTILPS